MVYLLISLTLSFWVVSMPMYLYLTHIDSFQFSAQHFLQFILSYSSPGWTNKHCRMRVGSGTYCCCSNTTPNPHLDHTVFGFPEMSCTPQIAPLTVQCEFSLGWGGVSLRLIKRRFRPTGLSLFLHPFFSQLVQGIMKFCLSPLHLWCVYITNPSMSFRLIWFKSFHSHFYYSFFLM